MKPEPFSPGWETLDEVLDHSETHFVCVCVFSRFTQIRLFVTLWTVAHRAPLSVGFSYAMILVWVAIPSSRRSS